MPPSKETSISDLVLFGEKAIVRKYQSPKLAKLCDSKEQVVREGWQDKFSWDTFDVSNELLGSNRKRTLHHTSPQKKRMSTVSVLLQKLKEIEYNLNPSQHVVMQDVDKFTALRMTLGKLIKEIRQVKHVKLSLHLGYQQ